MFIVKAELNEADSRSYHIFEAEAVRVAPSRMASSGGNTGPDPDREVELTDIDGQVKKTLYVGSGLGMNQYCAVYIMNASGKTVDSVYPYPPRATSAVTHPVYAVGGSR